MVTTMRTTLSDPSAPEDMPVPMIQNLDIKDDHLPVNEPNVQLSRTKARKSFLVKLLTPATPEELAERVDDLMYKRWGASDSITYQMVQNYWTSQRIEGHWQNLYKTKPRQFIKYMKKGYMEPIPLQSVLSICSFISLLTRA